MGVADDLQTEMRAVKKDLRAAGVPSKLLTAVETRALRSQRRTTGRYQSNRESRWKLEQGDPQRGTEIDCRKIFLRLCATLMEFEGAPSLSPYPSTQKILEARLGRPLRPNSFRDELTLEKLSYTDQLAEVKNPTPGISSIHIGHRDPTKKMKHKPDNVEWRTERSNLIQGNLTLAEARTKLVELIARYFQLGEVTITPDS